MKPLDRLKDQESLLTENEAASFLGLTPRFMQARRYSHSGPKYIRISHRCIRYRAKDLIEWIDSNSSHSNYIETKGGIQ